MLASPPPALLVDMPPSRQTTKRSTTPPATRDPAAKAAERVRLRQLVNDFTQEAAGGRPCTVVVLDSDPTLNNGGTRREARYTLGEEVQRFILLGRAQPRDPQVADNGEADWEPLGQWPLHAVLGTHRAEDSALVQSRQRELGRIVSREELGRSAVLEFGGGPFAGCVPLLLIEESREHCERFVSGMQILRLYKGAAQRLESARNSGDRRPNSPAISAPMGLLSQLRTASHIVETPSGGPSTPNPERVHSARANRPVGAVGADRDEPTPDAQCKETV